MRGGHGVSQGIRTGVLRVLGSAALLAALPLAANAATIATFDWVPFQNGGAGTGAGDLVLTLPGSVAGPGFDVHFANAAAAKSAVTGFSYTFSNGDSLSLANLQAGTLQMNPTDWDTTNTITPAGASPGLYLGTNFNFGGFVTPPGGVLTPFQLASSGGMVTLGAGDAQLRITDTGYWKLDSLSPVPLPAAGLLLISGLAGLFGVGRSGKFNRGAFGQ
jgi:hypothetical protein